MPVLVAPAAPLVGTLGTLEMGIHLGQGRHAVTVSLRALHQRPIPATDNPNTWDYVMSLHN